MEESETRYISDFCVRCGEVSCTLDFDEALEAIMKSVENCLQADATSIHLFDPSGRTASIAAARNLSERYLGQEPVPVREEPILPQIIKGKVVTIDDVPGDPNYQDLARIEGIKSLLCTPLKSRDRIIGALWAFSREPRRFTEDEISYAATLAGQGGVALGNARLHLSLHIISDIGKALTSRFELEEILQRIVQSAAELFGGKGASLFLLNREKNSLEFKTIYGMNEDIYDKKDMVIDRSVQQCLDELIAIPDLEAEKELSFPEHLEKEGVRSVLCSPLKVRGRAIGILRVYMEDPRDFSAEDRMLFQILADFGGIAIENARLYNHIKRDYEDLTRDVWNWYDWGERTPRI